MGSQAPILPAQMTPTVFRRMVNDLVDKGCAVVIHPDGTIRVTPPEQLPADPFDSVDMGR